MSHFFSSTIGAINLNGSAAAKFWVRSTWAPQIGQMQLGHLAATTNEGKAIHMQKGNLYDGTMCGNTPDESNIIRIQIWII